GRRTSTSAPVARGVPLLDGGCGGSRPSSCHREPGAKPVAALRSRTGLQLAAVDRDSLAHPDEPVPASVAVSVAAAVVAHRHLDVPVAVADEHLGVLRACMLERVREAFLDETV